MQQVFVLGSYAPPDQNGIYVCSFDSRSGEISILDSYAGLFNPSFLSVDARRRKVYAIAEISGPDGAGRGAAAAFDIGGDNRLSMMNVEETVPAPTCHISLDRTGSCLMVSSYRGGMLGLSPIAEDGRVGPAAEVHRHEGSSVRPAQTQARVHSATTDRNNRFAIVCDLGADKIVVYRLDLPGLRLIRQHEFRVAAGAGPRHFAFHPDAELPYGYVINELNATIIAFGYNETSGELKEIQTVGTLPPDYTGENACADIHISPDGKFLYGSNRGHDSIAVYEISGDGRLTFVEHASVLGRHPRNFALTPDGHFLLAANRDTNNITVFSRDAATGKLQLINSRFTVSKPVCIKFLHR